MAKKKSIYNDYYASDSTNDNYGTMFESMCKSEAYKSLGIGARHFYVLCRVHSKTNESRKCLYKHGQQFERTYTEHDFVFPDKQLNEYGIKKSNASRWFKELIEHGFIQVKENNKNRRMPNVYSFSDGWKKSKMRLSER